MASTQYPLVVYGPSGDPRDVHSSVEEAEWAAKGYRRHWHMGGTFGRPASASTPSISVAETPVSATAPAVVVEVPKTPGRPKKSSSAVKE